MIFAILKLVHAIFGTIGIGAGAWMAFCFLTGRPFMRWSIVFLKCSLVASAAGLLFPFHHFLPAHWAAMSGIYIAGMAVLASRKYHLVGIWGSIFAGCTMLVFSLNILVAIAHVFTMLIAPQHKPLFLITEFLAMLFLASFDLLIVRRYRTLPARLAVRPQVAGCN
jgi:hypothetical protein